MRGPSLRHPFRRAIACALSCGCALSMLIGCHEPDPERPEEPAPASSARPAPPVEATPVESAPAALACDGVVMVDHEGRRVPELLVRALGDRFEGTRASRGFGEQRSFVEGSDDRVFTVHWGHHRRAGSDGWDLDEARARIADRFDGASFLARSGSLGSSVMADLGAHPGGHFHLEVAVGSPGDVATLYCVAEPSAPWRLTVGHALRLGLLPARFPSAVLARLGDRQPLRGLVGTPTHLDLYFPPGSTPATDGILADLDAEGFAPVEPNDLARVAYQLRGGAPPLRALLVRSGMTLTITTTQPDDQFLYAAGADP